MKGAGARGNRVRIIGGQWRRRLLAFPSVAELRPTPDAVRETLFNWLGQDMEGQTCLDLFAGSGALGFEALSRGARLAVMVDADAHVLQALRENAAMLHAGNVELVKADALEFLARDRRMFDVIFLDPPYARKLLPELLPLVPAHLSDDGFVYVEDDSPVAVPAGWEAWRSGRAGRAHYHLLKKSQHA